MNWLNKCLAPDAAIARALDRLQPLFALAARIDVGSQFLHRAYLELINWDTTLYLFDNEYHAPLLTPHLAAVADAFGALIFALLIIVGLACRIGAAGLLAVNIMAVLSYSNVLLAEGAEAALGQHLLWATLLLFLMIYGPGKLSIDHLSTRSPP